MVVNKKTKKAPSKLELELDLSKELTKLSKQVENLKEMEFIKILGHPWRLMGYSFLKGVAAGFGSVVGASVVVAIFIYLLSQFSLVPFIGDYFTDLKNEINFDSYSDQSK